jgi:hypothetical protein
LSRFLAEKIISPENIAGKTSINIIPQITIKKYSGILRQKILSIVIILAPYHHYE